MSINPSHFEFSSLPANEGHAFFLYPTFGRLSAGGDYWQVAIRGRAVTPRPDNLRKAMMMRMLGRALDVSVSELESSVYFERVAEFLMLGLRDRDITVRIAGRLYPLKKPSKKSGYFESSIRVPSVEARENAPANSERSFDTLTFHHGAPQSEPHEGTAQLIAPVGPSVISDIDDTLKVTEAMDRTEMLRNTFLRPFEVIPGMADHYRTWATRNAAFHYVSASPWPLFRPLHDFLTESGFPQGSFHLRRIKFQGTGPLRLLVGGKRDKRKSVRNILRWYRHRKFLLIGDSGERDPEIYGWAARRYPDQIAQILIRRVTPIKRKRLKKAFRDVPVSKVRIFDSADELADISAIAHVGWQIGS